MTEAEIQLVRRRLRKLGLAREMINTHIERSIAAKTKREEKHEEFLRKTKPSAPPNETYRRAK